MKRKRYRAHVLIGILLLAAVACSQRPDTSISQQGTPAAELKAKIDKAVAYPGDVITFTLQTERLPDVTLEVPDISDRFSDFRLIGDGSSPPEEKGGRIRAERWYKLQADTAGSYIIDPIEAVYSMPDGTREVLKTPKIYLEIVSLLAEDEEAGDIRDIKPPVDISNLLQLTLIAVGTLLAVALVALIVRWAFARWRRRALEHKLASRPPHEEAREALEALLAKKLIEKGRQREFCFGVSEIFRRYMQARFGFPAIDLTTEEILPRIEENGIVKDTLKPLVRAFLTSTDLVKFAKYLATRQELEKIIQDTRTFINETTPEPAADTRSPKRGEAA